MGAFYFINRKNIKPLKAGQYNAILRALEALKDADLPFEYVGREPRELVEQDIKFFVDPGMTSAGILGAVKMFDNSVYLAPVIVNFIDYAPAGIPNNEGAMGTIIHELTHKAQMKWGFGLVYGLLNLPGICGYTLEAWARRNAEAAKSHLRRTHADMRTKG